MAVHGLKLPRRSSTATKEPWQTAPAQDDRNLTDEGERLRGCEAKLREYEARLQEWQERLARGDTSSPVTLSTAPFGTGHDPATDELALQIAWKKLYRARELLDAEIAHLRDERMSAQGREAEIQRREKALEQRERQLAVRDRLLTEAEAAVPAAPPAPVRQTSLLGQFTQAPFTFARNVLSAAK